MKRSRNPELKKQKIIEATHKILRESGYYTNFSLDAVAKEAGVSKGGLIHHFESKDALLTAVARDAIEKFEVRVQEEQAKDPTPPGAFTRAYINAILNYDPKLNTDMSPLLLGYLKNNGEAEEARFQYWQKFSEKDGIDPTIGSIIRLAIDGIIYTEMIDNQPIDPALREQIRLKLGSLITR